MVKMSKEILTLNSQTVIGMVHCLPLGIFSYCFLSCSFSFVLYGQK